jgi:hypothetical protein
MSLRKMLRHTIIVYHQLTVPGSGTPVTDFDIFGNPIEATIFGDPVLEEDAGTEWPAWVSPSRNEEIDPGRETRLTYCEVETVLECDVLATDHVVWEGDHYEVIGAPQVIPGRTHDSHIHFTMRKVEG